MAPWKKGQSGNPGGRPKGRSITAELNKLIADESSSENVAKALAEEAIKRAKKGDFRFWNAIVERLDGKVVDVIQTESMNVHVHYMDPTVPVDDEDVEYALGE